MKIKNIDAFREELFKNIKNLWFDTGCDVYRCSKITYEYEQLKPENRNILACRTLENVLVVEKYHYDDTYKKVKDKTLCVSFWDNEVMFHKNDTEQQCFIWWYDMSFDDYANKMEFAMNVVLRIADFVKG